MKSDIFKILGAFFLLIIVFLAGTLSIRSVIGSVIDKNNLKVIANTKIVDLSFKDQGIQWSPDGHISYITFPNGTRRYFIAGNQRAYEVESKTNETFEDTVKNNPVINSVFGPDANSGYKNNYATIGEVLQTDKNDPYHVFGFTQYEQQGQNPDGTYNYGKFTASIGLLESYDGGLTWKDFGPVIRGDDYMAPGTRISGAGEPTAIVKDGYVYVYYVDWAAQINVFHADQIYLARTKIESNGGLSSFEFYTVNGFSASEQNLQPVVSETTGSGYASLPSVSYNKYLGSYLMIYETNSEFYSSTSTDGITWTTRGKLLAFPQSQSNRKSGDIWYSYPTLLSDGTEASDQFTDQNGNLYFSKGVWPNTAHQPAKSSFELK